jgi:hypothetical protein
VLAWGPRDTGSKGKNSLPSTGRFTYHVEKKKEKNSENTIESTTGTHDAYWLIVAAVPAVPRPLLAVFASLLVAHFCAKLQRRSTQQTTTWLGPLTPNRRIALPLRTQTNDAVAGCDCGRLEQKSLAEH